MPSIHSLEAGQRLAERTFTPSNVSLFMYNAAIWNAHRIHYDERYTTEVEKHPGVVIDGPLQGDWLTQVVLDWLGDCGEMLEFEYSNRKASYLGQTLTSGGVVDTVDATSGEVALTLYIKDEAGVITTPGTARVRLAR